MRDTPVCVMVAANSYAGYDISNSLERFKATYVLAKPFSLKEGLEKVIGGMQQKALQEK